MASHSPHRNKLRLDQFLVDSGRCASKSQAQGMILAGQVRINQQVVDKPGSLYTLEALNKATIDVERPLPYVSRGGLKLEKALQTFPIQPKGIFSMDVGASTGGFTDCLLQNGAQKVYSIDVGHGQLDWKLRQDERVVSLEKTNIRNVTQEQIPDPIGLCVMDVSFISIKKTIPHILNIFDAGLERLSQPPVLMSLIKPQFEYKDYCNAPGFDGVVKDSEQHEVILQGLLQDLQTAHPRLKLLGLSFSPITGPKGNMEFLLYAQYLTENASGEYAFDIGEVVKEAHQALGKPQH